MITYEGIVIEAENEKQVQDLVQSYFKTNPESFVISRSPLVKLQSNYLNSIKY